MPSRQRLVIVGAGNVARAVVVRLPSNWEVVLVDLSEAVLADFPERAKGGLTRVLGDGTSRLVLARCGLDANTVLLAATRSDETNKEVARLARQAFGVEERVVLLDVVEGLEEAGLGRAEVVARHLAAAARVLNALPLGEAHATTLGLGEGEILQVTVLEGSPAVGRELRTLAARDWIVAAVYRDGRLIVPHGLTAARPGDRILLVGEPDELRMVAAWFRGGEPTFPTLYGPRVGWIGERAAPLARWIAERTPASEVVEVEPGLLDPGRVSPADAPGLAAERALGCLVVPPVPVPALARLGLVAPRQAELLLSYRLPVLVARGGGPIARILVAVGPQQEVETVVGVAMDLARELGATLTALTVLAPRVAEGGAEADPPTPRQIARLAHLRGLVVERVTDEGNPIERIRHHAAATDLLVVGYTAPRRRSTVFSPDVSLFLLHDAPCSTLLVPRGAA